MLVLAVLAYADDIVLLANTVKDLQKQLDCLHNWCVKWRMEVNVSKTKIVHFRQQHKRRTQAQFWIGGKSLEVVDRYKYLGISVEEFGQFDEHTERMVNTLLKGIQQTWLLYHKLGGMGFKILDKLWKDRVSQVAKYALAIWGWYALDRLDVTADKLMHTFFGVNNKACTAVLRHQCQWRTFWQEWVIESVRVNNHIQKVSSDRILKKAWELDNAMAAETNNWTNQLRKELNRLKLTAKVERFQP